MRPIRPRCRQCGVSDAVSPDGLCAACVAGQSDRTRAPGAEPAGDGTWDAGEGSAVAVARGSSPQEPERIGPYRVLSLIGEGGMGTVYLAEQQTPHRRVAVKVVKAGMDTRQVVARFEIEREALALMDHPSIATVFDAGVTDEARPYFAMEYVSGVPITDYCDRHQLSTSARLTLFLDVCAAIQHAHQKGVIHRDIKPSNVLVTVAGGVPRPKVIDFGVAKATNQRLTAKTIFTELGILVGTPEYMSPEQAEMTGLDVDTTTDIYSLGVLLYELLVGALPFDSVRLRRAGYAEIQRIIREEEPAKPSTRVSGLGETGGTVARLRRTDLLSLARELRGDLDWITLKAMDKDRTRRYAAASEFAADLRRHLADEPIVARPVGVAYRATKFVRRHRAGVAAGAVVVLLTLASGVALALQSRRIAVERDLAVRERDRAEAVSGFLVSLFEASDPDRSKGEKVTARQLLDLGRQRLDTELKDQPQTRAALLHVIGRVYGALDVTDVSEKVLTEALDLRRDATGRDRIDLAETMNELARVHVALGRNDVAESMQQSVLALRQAVWGPEHIEVARTMANLGASASRRGSYAEAEQSYRPALAMAERLGSPVDVARIQANLANTLMNQGRLMEAMALFRTATSVLTRELGPENTVTQQAMNNFGVALNRAGQHEEGERTHREILRVRRKLLGPDHFQITYSLFNLGGALAGLGRFGEAEQVFEESLVIHRSGNRPPHLMHAWSLSDLASTQKDLGKYAEAEGNYRSAIDMFQKAPNSPPTAVAFAWDGLGSLYFAQGRFAAAETALRRALDVRSGAQEGSGHPLAQSMERLGQVLCERRVSVEGERLAREALEMRRAGTPPSPSAIAFTEAVLGRCLTARGRFGDAEPLVTKAYQTLLEQHGTRRDATRYAARAATALYEAWGKPAEAATWRERQGR